MLKISSPSRNEQWAACAETRNRITEENLLRGCHNYGRCNCRVDCTKEENMTAAKYVPAAEERVKYLRYGLKGTAWSKSYKEAMLKELRGLESELGLDSTYPRGYNKP